VLKIQEVDRNEVHFESNPLIYRRGIAGYQYVVNFIMNRVPSDIYRIKNPKFPIEKDAPSLNLSNAIQQV
jgi:hypothetical protein